MFVQPPERVNGFLPGWQRITASGDVDQPVRETTAADCGECGHAHPGEILAPFREGFDERPNRFPAFQATQNSGRIYSSFRVLRPVPKHSNHIRQRTRA